MQAKLMVAAAAVALAFVFAPATRPQTQEVSSKVAAGGLQNLSYRGANFLSNGTLRIVSVVLRSGDSSRQLDNPTPIKVEQLSATKVRHTYSWGIVEATYDATGTKLGIAIKIENTSGKDTIWTIGLEPLTIAFPQRPLNYDLVLPHLATNLGGPTAILMEYDAGGLLIANEDVQLPLLIGLPYANDRPAPARVFPLRVHTGKAPYGDHLPYLHRPIEPGKSDRYEISVRFGQLASMQALAEDILKRYRETYPQMVKWEDRRPIGALHVATSGPVWTTNPRHWLQDPTIDVFSEEGRADFRRKMLAWADGPIKILHDMNAQGAIVWNIEGEEYAHPTSYIGDPRLAEMLAPELDGVVDDFFRKFIDAGLRIGVTIRPQKFLFDPNSRGAAQSDAPDPAQEIIDKIDYAKARWGATLFYIDSNGAPSTPMSPDWLYRISQAHPEVLLIPEQKSTYYYSRSAPYQDSRLGAYGTPDFERMVYPDTFSVVYASGSSVRGKLLNLVDSVKQGDVLMFPGWYEDEANDVVRRAYVLGTKQQ